MLENNNYLYYLYYLDLSNITNEDDDFFIHIFKSLKYNFSISILNLNDNNIMV